MAEELSQLRDILSDAVDTIIHACKQRNEDFPRLRERAQPSEFSPGGIRNDPAVASAIKLGISAAAQLIATLQSPIVSITHQGNKAMVPANLNVVERLHIAEILSMAGEEGMHISEIVQYNGSSEDKLGRVLRQLATNHIFREVSPDVFAHNMISSLLDTGKDFEEIKKEYALVNAIRRAELNVTYFSPGSKFDNTNGVAAFASFSVDGPLKAIVYLSEVMIDPTFAHSQEPHETSIQKAFNSTETLWQLFERPENVSLARRFNASMKATSAMQPASSILTLYDWAALPQGATVVDVGCGLGHVSLEICSVRPDLNFILEDRSSVINDTRANWTNTAHSLNDNVHFLDTDYLQPQPELPSTPDVFLLRNIIHDLSDKLAVVLLRNLRKAATSSTKLLVVDFILEYACPLPKSENFGVSGYEPMTAPSPLLPNFGVAGSFPYDMDIAMLNLFNSKERTMKNWQHIFGASGWKIVRAHRSKANWAWWPSLVAEPVEQVSEYRR